MIEFPKPLNWFQKEVWRIKWLEWIVIINIMYIWGIILSIVSGDISNIDFFFFGILTSPIYALLYSFIFKYFLLIFIIPFRFISLFPGFGYLIIIVKFFEAIGKIISDINNHIIARFCEKKVKFDPELSTEHWFGKK